MTTSAFVTGGEPVLLRGFITPCCPQGATPPGRRPLTRLAVWVSALKATIDITRARTERGHTPVRTIDDGLEELSQS